MTLTKPLQGLKAQIGSFDRSARLFLFATALDGIVFSAWNLFFNFYILGLGFDRAYLGLVNAMPSIGALIFGIPLGALSDRIGRKPAMLLGVAVSVVSIGLEVTVRDPNLILFFAFLQGVGITLYYLSQAPFMMKASNEDNRAMLFSLNWGLVTISGAVGSLFASVLAGCACKLLFFSALTGGQALWIAAVLSVSGQIGDLLESLIKRSYGIKDSGRMLPGHGGILDRIDSLLLAALLVAVPGLSLAQLPLIDETPLERLPAYWSSSGALPDAPSAPFPDSLPGGETALSWLIYGTF